jgi:hypothetical protein
MNTQETIILWAIENDVPVRAVNKLLVKLAAAPILDEPRATDTREEANLVRVRLEATRAGWHLWRNNSGVAYDPRGVPVRFGLANDSAKLNAAIKSSDLIGIKPGGQFVAIEVKRGGWEYSGTKREQAQKKFLDLVAAMGGYAKFSTGDL